MLTGGGKLELDIQRDRQGTCVPQLIAKYQRRFPAFDDKIVSLYARGMSTREIATWQARPLEAIYPPVFFDALRVKIRDGTQ